MSLETFTDMLEERWQIEGTAHRLYLAYHYALWGPNKNKAYVKAWEETPSTVKCLWMAVARAEMEHLLSGMRAALQDYDIEITPKPAQPMAKDWSAVPWVLRESESAAGPLGSRYYAGSMWNIRLRSRVYGLKWTTFREAATEMSYKEATELAEKIEGFEACPKDFD